MFLIILLCIYIQYTFSVSVRENDGITTSEFGNNISEIRQMTGKWFIKNQLLEFKLMVHQNINSIICLQFWNKTATFVTSWSASVCVILHIIFSALAKFNILNLEILNWIFKGRTIIYNSHIDTRLAFSEENSLFSEPDIILISYKLFRKCQYRWKQCLTKKCFHLSDKNSFNWLSIFYKLNISTL